MINYSAYTRILCLTYTALISKQPRYLYDIIKLKENTRLLRSSNSLLLSNQKCNLDTYGKRRFSVSAPVLWNNLPLHLRRCNSIKTFKKAVTNYLLCWTWALGLILSSASARMFYDYSDHKCICPNVKVLYLILFYHLIHLWYYFTLFKTQMRTYLFVILCINKLFNSIQYICIYKTFYV